MRRHVGQAVGVRAQSFNLRQPRSLLRDAPEQRRKFPDGYHEPPLNIRTAIAPDTMGSAESKQVSAHVWKSSAPNGLSQDLVDSLQSSHETDASRAKIVEHQIQARVAEELKKLQQQEAESLKAAQEKLASIEFKDDGGPSNFTVGKEIEEMRKKLEARKQVRALPESVEGARNEVIRCLRENDRRPLDCWQEVENFKAEVKKLEKGWVEKVVA
ncbi:hypothetical protein EDB81DRAFT_45929 [Dactylonectria macrodidyma]|uniref:MICOS complex subunit mic19 n=1 Tax=Dactylonectria macrodidyma TaxID=307937 RepID=A0A9P9FUT8_9HYPO|nr:hypothetical protein EDB81DRAFT_45929 [Dactylonectria macrodidyma]